YSLIGKSSSVAVRLVCSHVMLRCNTFQNSLGAAISMDLASNPVITGVTLSNNGVNALTLDAGTLSGNRFWDDPDIVYRLSGDVTVAAGSTLTIAPGMVVKARTFNGDDIIVSGTLIADATSAQPIIFT